MMSSSLPFKEADRRKALVKEVEEARKEFERGECRPATPEEIMKEIGL